MEDKILKDIIEYASQKLTGAYGYCGVAEGPSMAALNSDDGKGGEIKINIKIEVDER